MGTLEITISEQQARALARDGGLALAAGEVATSYGEISIVIDVEHGGDRATDSGPVDLSRLRGVFHDGWGADDIDRVLPVLEAELGVELRCLWEYVDQAGFGGHSTLVVLSEYGPREIGGELWRLLVEGSGDGLISPRSVSSESEADVEIGFRSRNCAGVDRRLAGADPQS